MYCSMPGFPVHNHLLGLAQTHVHWVSDAISSSVVPYSSCLQSFPVLRSFPVSRLFTSGGQNIGASASVSIPPMNIQDWFPLGLTGLISLQSKGLSRVFSTVQKHQFFSTQPSLWASSHIHTWLLDSLVAQMVKNLPLMQETWVQSLGWEDPLEEGMATHFSILAWRTPWTEEPGGLQSMGSQRVGHDWMTKNNMRKLSEDLFRASLVAQLVKNLPAMREIWVRSLGWEDPLEKGTVTHSSILAWRIPWTVWPMGLQRAKHDRVTFPFDCTDFAGKVMSLLFNMLSRFVIAFLPRSKHLLISD